MGISDLTSADAVEQAIAEFDQIGRAAFHTRYGFRESRSYYLVHQGRRYDSKAIVGAAIGFQHPASGQLAGRDFVGGRAIVERKLASLGFTVVSDADSGDAAGMASYSSEQLTVGDVYPREELIERFAITDATVNTGVFRPAGTKSIWLFVTRDKTNDRTQYRDRLEGDLLHWEGQTSGRTDRMIVEHEQNDDELLLFYRDSKRQHPKAGFRFEGPFRYLSHQPGNPSRFTLQRIGSPLLEGNDPGEGDQFDPADLTDGRKRVLATVARRQGQAGFRRELMKAYGGRCAITGCAIEPLLEAAHIHPYLGPETNHVTNGLLLRADIHTLFDLGLIALDSQRRLVISPRLASTEYAALAGSILASAGGNSTQASAKALKWHRDSSSASHPSKLAT